jgi:glutaminyl-tRNA synthetase
LKGYIHWVSKEHSIDAEVRVYNHLFKVREVKDDWFEQINPESLIVKSNAKVWRKHADDKEGDRYQFERLGYFVIDKDSKTDSVDGKVIFNRIVELKESKEKKINLGK